jgi:dipeptidyl aminopeptidase/acylaminoacyl peptidase
MTLTIRTIVAVATTSLVAVNSGLAQTRGVTAEDYYAFETLSDPHFSPDGSTIAYTVTTVDQKQNQRRSEIWSIASDSSRPPVPLTTSPQSSNSPRWSPDGKSIAFLSARPAAGDAAADPSRNQVWLLPLSGGEPQRLTGLANGVSSFQWSPDGTRLVIVSRSGPSDEAKSPSDVRHYLQANYNQPQKGQTRPTSVE